MAESYRAAECRDYAACMRALRNLVRMAWRRLRWQRGLELAAPGLLVAAGVAVAALLVSRWMRLEGWWIAAAGGCAAGAALMWALGRVRPVPSERGAAIEIDARLGLEGRIASALALDGREDPFARAAVEDGARLATDPSVLVRARRAFRVSMPARMAWVPVAWFAFALLAWMVPTRAVSSQEQPSDNATTSREELEVRASEAENRVQEAVQILAESPEAQQELKELLQEFATTPPPAVPGDSAGGRDAKQREAEALQRAAALEQRLSEALDAPELEASQELQDFLAALPNLPNVDPALLESLKTGQMEAAMQALEKLAKDAAGGDPKRAEAARKSLESLAQAIERAEAAGSRSMAAALEKAGLDAKLAQDPAGAAQAIEEAAKAGAISKEQAQALQKQAQAQQQAQQQKKELARSMRECKNGSSESARRQLSRQQAAQRMQATLQMAMQQCNSPGQAGWSMPWTRGKSSKSNSGGSGGGKGSGSGGSGKPGQSGAPDTNGRTDAIPDGKLANKQESAGDGSLLDDAAARDFVRAEGPPSGTSNRQIQAVAAKVAAGLEEGSEEDPVPGRLKQAHKRYFEQWKKRLEEKGAGAPPSTP
jgi:hypothetical protein